MEREDTPATIQLESKLEKFLIFYKCLENSLKLWYDRMTTKELFATIFESEFKLEISK